MSLLRNRRHSRCGESVTVDIYLPIVATVSRERDITYATTPSFPQVPAIFANMERTSEGDVDSRIGNYPSGVEMLSVSSAYPIARGSRVVMIVNPDGSYALPGQRRSWTVDRVTHVHGEYQLRLEPEEGLR